MEKLLTILFVLWTPLLYAQPAIEDFKKVYRHDIIEIGFNRNLLWTTLFQYVDQNEFMGINSRLQWRFAPMSDAFFVFVDNYDVYNGLNQIRNAKSNNRALILKVNYWY